MIIAKLSYYNCDCKIRLSIAFISSTLEFYAFLFCSGMLLGQSSYVAKLSLDLHPPASGFLGLQTCVPPHPVFKNFHPGLI